MQTPRDGRRAAFPRPWLRPPPIRLLIADAFAHRYAIPVSVVAVGNHNAAPGLVGVIVAPMAMVSIIGVVVSDIDAEARRACRASTPDQCQGHKSHQRHAFHSILHSFCSLLLDGEHSAQRAVPVSKRELCSRVSRL